MSIPDLPLNVVTLETLNPDTHYEEDIVLYINQSMFVYSVLFDDIVLYITSTLPPLISPSPTPITIPPATPTTAPPHTDRHTHPSTIYPSTK